MANTHSGHRAVMSPRWGVAFVITVLAAPVLVGAAYGVVAAGTSAQGTVSIATLLGRLSDPTLLRNVAWSIAIAATSTALACALALLVAMYFRGSHAADRLARTLATLPLPIPPVVVATAGVLLLGQSGVLARVAASLGMISLPAEMPPLLYHPIGVGLIAMLVWKELGFLAMLACTLAAQVDPRIEEAARTLGADEADVRRRVILPLVWRGLLPGAAAAFVFVLGSFELPLLLGPSRPQALGVMILERSRDADPAALGDAHAAALLALVIAGLAVFVHRRLSVRA